MAVYEVESPKGEVTLVECRTQKAAVNHVASKGYKTKTLNMSEVVKRVKAGVQIETLVEEKKDPAAEPAPILEAIEAAEAGKASDAIEEGKKSFSGRFQKKSA